MTRNEHLEWCKRRALEYVDAGDVDQAMASMLSDLGKHPELENHIGKQLMFAERMSGRLTMPHEMRKFIEGFN